MRNETLRRALAEHQLSPAKLAELVQVDPKSVSRWLADAGMTPQTEARWRVAELVGVDETVLWPQLIRNTVKTGPDREVLSVYTSHSAVPPSVWLRLVSEAKREIIFCDTVSYWYWHAVPELTAILRAKALSGVRVRIMVGIPDDPRVRADEEATDMPMTLSVRIAQTLHLLEPLRGTVELRQTNEGFGRSVYLGDDEAVAHWWLHGRMGIDFPAMHLRRHQDGGLFDALRQHAEALWADAEPVW